MHYALLQAAPHARVVGAFEISDLANDVYEHNHGWRPWQGNIETVRCLIGFRSSLLSGTRLAPQQLRQHVLF
jgi:tRNA (cytosine38-C5)-methyltransferase